PRADATTRTFRVEISTPNPENIPSGTSATVEIPKKSVLAHFITASLLTLDSNGRTGVKTVDDDGIVIFHPVQIISAETNGIYVVGLPDNANLIINGQGFADAGVKVKTVAAKTEAANETVEYAP